MCKDFASKNNTLRFHKSKSYLWSLENCIKLDCNYKLHAMTSPTPATRLQPPPLSDTNENELVRGKNILKCVQMYLET